MSGQLLSWAIDEGERRDYPQSTRMLLVVLVKMAKNGSGESFAGKDCLLRQTGGSLRGNFNAMATLVEDGLVQREKRGKSWLYRVVSPVLKANGHDNTSAPDADMVVSSASLADLEAMSSALDADKASAIAALDADEGKNIGKIDAEHRHPVHFSSAPDADRTYLRGTKKEELSAHARATLPDGGRASALEDKADPPPQEDTPQGSTRPPDPFDDAGEDNAGYVARLLHRRAVALTIPRPKAYYAPPEVLRAARERLMALS